MLLIDLKNTLMEHIFIIFNVYIFFCIYITFQFKVSISSMWQTLRFYCRLDSQCLLFWYLG